MTELRSTLLTDGSSDDALIPLLSWLLRKQGLNVARPPLWADLRRLVPPPSGLTERLRQALIYYPCDLLFIHRDAEAAPRNDRVDEIEAAAAAAMSEDRDGAPFICVIPVRMTEAWLLFDEPALRWAAGNPNGRERLEMPRLRDIEGLPDPKDLLFRLLRSASGLHGRRLKTFPISAARRRLASRVEDFSPLRALPAFRALEADVQQFVTSRT